MQAKQDNRRPITAGQMRFYEKLVERVKETNRPATTVEMAEVMGYASDNASRKMLDALEIAGWIHARDVVKQRRRIGAWPVDVPLGLRHKKDAEPKHPGR